jgi:hypothetical protein
VTNRLASPVTLLERSIVQSRAREEAMSTMEPDEGTQSDDQQADAPRFDKTEAANPSDAPRWDEVQETDRPDAPRWDELQETDRPDAPRWDEVQQTGSDDAGSLDPDAGTDA